MALIGKNSAGLQKAELTNEDGMVDLLILASSMKKAVWKFDHCPGGKLKDLYEILESTFCRQ